jgi:hypothetical protein
MDTSTITAEACLGIEGHDRCSFLKYIDDQPTCTYHMEMKAMFDKPEVISHEAEDKETVKKAFEALLKEAKFDEHAIYRESMPVKIRLFNTVQHKVTGAKGQVISRSAKDDSLTVEWADGNKSVAWEIELENTRTK